MAAVTFRPEPSLQLALVTDTSPLQDDWISFVQDDENQSYASVLPFDTHKASWTTYAQLDSWFDALHPSQYIASTHSNVDKRSWTSAAYQGQTLLRQTAWVTLHDDCRCDYGYSDTWQERATCSTFRRVVKEITAYVQDATGMIFNAVNLNYYPPGGGVGWHADDEFLWDAQHRPVCIVSLSLGRGADDGLLAGARKFMVRPIPGQYNHIGAQHHGGVKELVLKHGDLMSMEGMFQKHYLHCIWPGDDTTALSSEDPLLQGERINLTFRTIVQHLDGSPFCQGNTCPLSEKPSMNA